MRLTIGLFLSGFLLACAPEEPAEPPPECTEHGQCLDDSKPYCDPQAQACTQLPVGYQIGWGDGEPETVEIEEIYQAPGRRVIRSLDFRPDTTDLWLTEGQAVRGARACNKTNATPELCEPKGADILVIYRATTTADRTERLRDGNAFHFMRNPTGLVFGDNEFFATCPESRTANFDNEVDDFAGPTLWSAARSIFTVDIGKNGSHMDMLHFTPFCMGIEHERDNVYWTFNGQKGSIDRCDFKEDHGPGEADHSDGEILRYISDTLGRVEDVSSQLALDHENGYLYIADTGNRRIVRLDTRSGTRGAMLLPNYDSLQVHHLMDNADFEVLDLEGSALGMPSGLIFHDGLLYIADFSFSEFRVVTTEGEAVRTLYTDFEPDSIGSMVLGPDDRIYFTVPDEGKVFRINHDLR